MTARIYCPTKSAMQSGKKNTHSWVLEIVAQKGKTLDPLMGWTGSSDMESQIQNKTKLAKVALKNKMFREIERLSRTIRLAWWNVMHKSIKR